MERDIKITGNNLSAEKISIKIGDNISLTLKKEEYNALSKLMCSSMQKEIDEAKRLNEWSKCNLSMAGEFVEGVRGVFYDCHGGDDWVWKRPASEIDEEKLSVVLEKYNDFLGFEP